MDDRDKLRIASVTERRTGHERRRVAIPTEWPEAREYLDNELADVWGAVESMAEDVHAIRRIMERLSWRQGLMWAIGVAVLGVVLAVLGRQIDRTLQAAIPPPVTAEHRLEVIVDILGEIPPEAAYRLSSGPLAGAPRLDVLRQHLPLQPPVTRLERDLACTRVPDACGARLGP